MSTPIKTGVSLDEIYPAPMPVANRSPSALAELLGGSTVTLAYVKDADPRNVEYESDGVGPSCGLPRSQRRGPCSMALTTAATRVLPAGMAVLPDDPDAVAIAAPAKLNLSLA
ncbi:MAG: hypothetical protein WCO71_01350, partial [Pseudomonadota bacterium]